MRRIEYSRRREEASCGVRGELLNRKSGVRIPAPASHSRVQVRLTRPKGRRLMCRRPSVDASQLLRLICHALAGRHWVSSVRALSTNGRYPSQIPRFCAQMLGIRISSPI